MKYLICIHHGIGDCVNYTPALLNIIELDAEACIDLIIHKIEYADIFYGFPNIYNIYVISDIKKELFRGSYDIGIIPPYVYNKRKAYILLKLMGCKKICFNKKNCVWNRHICIRCEDDLKYIGINVKHKFPKLYIPVIDKKEFLKRYKKTEKIIIGIAIGGNVIKNVSFRNKWAYGTHFKSWPIKNYIDVINRLPSECLVVLLGGKTENEIFSVFADEVEHSYIDFQGKCSIKESAEVISVCDIVIGNDTGMLHVAGAMGVKTISIHGPTNPKMCGVYSRNALFIEPQTECRYCYEAKGDKTFNCSFDMKCMRTILPQRVFETICEVLNIQKV